MRSIVVYHSKSGFTKKYAEWISEKAKAELKEVSEVTIADLQGFDTIVYGGNLHAAGIQGIHKITDHLNLLQGKRLIFFATGASPYRESVVADILEANFPKEIQNEIQFFYLRGGFDYHKLPRFERFLMILLKWKIYLKPKSKRHPDEIGMLQVMKTPMDYTKEVYLKDLLLAMDVA